MSTTPSYVKNMVSMAVQSIGQRGVGFLASLLLARTLSAAEFGSYSITNITATSICSMTRAGVDVGVHTLTARHDPASDPERISEILGNSLTLFLAITFVGAVTCFLASPLIATWLFGNENLTPFIRIAAPLVVFQIFWQFAYVAFAGLHHFTTFSWTATASAPLPPALAIAGGLIDGAFGAAAGLVLGQGIATLALLFALWRLCRRFQVRLVPRASIDQFRSILKLGFPYYAAMLLITPLEYFAYGLLVSTHGIDAAGNMRVVVTITSIVSLLPMAINGPMVSAFIRSNRRQSEQHGRFVLFNIKVLMAFGLLANAAGGPLFADAVRILFGAKYADAAATGYISLLSAIMAIVFGVISNNMLAKARLGILFVANACHSALFGTAAFVLIPRIGLEGYLLAHLIPYVALLLYVAIRFVFFTGTSADQARPVVAMAVLSIAVAGAIFWIYSGGVEASLWLRIGMAVALPALVAWTSWRFIFTADELETMVQKIPGLSALVR